MTISDLKELDKLLALCRKRGVESIEIDGIKIHLNDSPKQNKASDLSLTQEPELSNDDVLFYSATPVDGGG